MSEFNDNHNARGCPAKRTLVSVLVTASLAASGGVAALELETGNPDLAVRWDNTVRYNYGVRAHDCDKNICGNGLGAGDYSAHQSDSLFAKKGDVVTNRFDLFSELDVVYKGDSGIRISGQAWQDSAYSGKSPAGDAAFLGIGGQAFPNGQYTDYVKKWNAGPSGEILDAFAFTKFNIGETPTSVKVGQHNIYWGESLFSFVSGVAYGQGPVDIRKALANPGVEAKEVFKPLNQISFQSTLNDRMVLAGQYYLDWKPSTLPDGGTYFGPADFFSAGGGTQFFDPSTSTTMKFNGTKAPTKKSGDWGLALKVRPESYDVGTLGFYYREFTDKLPQMVLGGLSGANPIIDLDYQTPRQKLFGASIAKQVGSVSVGSDVTYRKGAQLGATPFANVIGANMAGTDWRPRGDVWTGLVNAIAYFGKNAVFDSAALQAELNYSHLIKVTNDPNSVFYGLAANCGADGVLTNHGCPGRSAWGAAVAFEPKWFAVFPGTDVSMPMFYGKGLKGNSPVPFGDNEGQGQWSLGVAADVRQKYNIALKYNGFIAKHSNDVAGMSSNSNSSLGKYWDRDWVSLTLKTTF